MLNTKSTMESLHAKVSVQTLFLLVYKLYFCYTRILTTCEFTRNRNNTQVNVFPGVGAVFAHPGLGRGYFFSTSAAHSRNT